MEILAKNMLYVVISKHTNLAAISGISVDTVAVAVLGVARAAVLALDVGAGACISRGAEKAGDLFCTLVAKTKTPRGGGSGP